MALRLADIRQRYLREGRTLPSDIERALGRLLELAKRARVARLRGFRRRGIRAGAADRFIRLHRVGQIGHIARGIVFGMIGLFLIIAALHANPGEARGIDGALAALAEQSFGPILLGAVALGFVAYGLYMFAEARYRRMVVN